MSSTPVDVAKGEAGVGDRRIVEDWNKARRVGHDSSIEHRLVPIGQTDKIDVPLKVGLFGVQMSQHPLDLPVEAFGRRR
jgi:hypothetical protein